MDLNKFTIKSQEAIQRGSNQGYSLWSYGS